MLYSNMEKIDGRRVNQETLKYLRERCITLRKSGKRNSEVANTLGLAPQTTSRWWRICQEFGKRALRPKKVGRPKGSRRALSPEQEKHIIRLLIDKNPKELKFKFALWTRESVKALIDREFKIDMPISTVGYYLKEWQFRAKKPIKRAYGRNDAKAKAWMEEEYPRIKKQAKAEDAEIWWGDETSCISLPHNLKGYAPKGEKPILKHTAKKFRINMISAITNTGKSMFSLYDEAINTERFVDFLQKIIDSSDRKVYLILDNLRVHHAKIVKAWVEEHKEQIELFYLPAYSPDLNPDEYLNQDYKQSANRNKVPTTKKQLEINTKAYMESLTQNPQKVKNFFLAESVRYAS